MNVLQKRLAQIGTKPHGNGLRDAIVYEDAKNQCYWIYNRYSHCEWLKYYMECYAVVSREEATEKLAQNSLFATQFIFHCAMEIAKGRMYW